MIILIYLNSAAVQMFFPKMVDAFFISEKELATLTFKEVLENRGLNVDTFKKFFETNVSIDLLMIYFLQKLFNLNGIIGTLSTGQEYAHFQAFQQKISIHLNGNNENIDDTDGVYGVPSNNINIEEKEVLNENKTKEKEKKGKKKFLFQVLLVILKHVLLNGKRNLKKIVNNIYLNLMISDTRKKKMVVLTY
jgi:hypothetical protein